MYTQNARPTAWRTIRMIFSGFLPLGSGTNLPSEAARCRSFPISKMFWWHVYEKTNRGSARRIVIGCVTSSILPLHGPSSGRL